MIESMDFEDPVLHLKNSGLPYFEHKYNGAFELLYQLLTMYLPGSVTEIQKTATSIHIIFPDQEITIPLNPQLDSTHDTYAMVEKLNMLFQEFEVAVRIYGIYYNDQAVYNYFICTSAEAAAVFSLFEANKEIRLTNTRAYFRVVFVLPQAENSRESIVYNTGVLPLGESAYNFLKASGFSLPLALVVFHNSDFGETIRVLRKYSDTNEEMDEYANGIIFKGSLTLVTNEAQALYQSHANGYYAFANAILEEYRNEAGGFVQDTFILKLDNQFEVLHYRHTHGMNYNVTTAHIVEKLKTWDQKYGLTIEGVDYDWVDFTLHRVPEDLDEFANELYAFCPDCIDQGVGSIDELKYVISSRKYVCLWWD
ncbi:hypothetical protein A3860_21300 [Niastella vici]|uniref:DUF4253 domain-containing protein n=1 Tax=Niastella vici TaxID=1703345 RepID=A0A1V9G056_9BACT|nr:DUF4253 domain-containing protein [Niastella vici]OQP63962.1 hypothetical protein A3860_21300 [Niastella vici]